MPIAPIIGWAFSYPYTLPGNSLSKLRVDCYWILSTNAYQFAGNIAYSETEFPSFTDRHLEGFGPTPLSVVSNPHPIKVREGEEGYDKDPILSWIRVQVDSSLKDVVLKKLGKKVKILTRFERLLRNKD